MTEDRVQSIIFDAAYYKDKLEKANKRIAKYIAKIEELETELRILKENK